MIQCGVGGAREQYLASLVSRVDVTSNAQLHEASHTTTSFIVYYRV